MVSGAMPVIAAGITMAIGLAFLITSAVIFGVRTDQEVKLWYNVPLCPTQYGNSYVSRALTSTGTTMGQAVASDSTDNDDARRLADAAPAPQTACPSPLGDNSSAIQTLTFNVDGSFFLPNSKYTTFLMSTDGVDIGENAAAFVKVEMNGVFSVDTGVTAPKPASRRLLKGSFGGGGSSGGSSGSSSSFRSRNGGYSYYGTTIYRRRYGRSGVNAVTSNTVVMIYSPGPIYSARTATGANTFVATDGPACTDAKQGCEFTLVAGMTKNELATATFTTPAKISSTLSYKVTVSARVNYTIPASGSYPNLFVTFSTDDTNPDSYWGWIGLPISIVVCLFGPFLVFKCCRDDMFKCGRTGRAWDDATSTTSSPLNNQWDNNSGGYNSALAAVDPAVQLPQPAVAGRSVLRRDGSETNLMNLPHDAARVDLSENDINSLWSNGDHPNLKSLDVSGNDLLSLSGITMAARSLEALSAVGNDISNLVGLGGLPNLMWLDVRDNRLRSLDCDGQVPNLRYLGARDNDIVNVSGLANFPNLTHLDLGGNDIVSVDKLAAMCPQLQCINLAQNNMTDETGVVELARLPYIRHVNVKGNDFTAAQRQNIVDAFAVRPEVTLLH